MSLPINTISSKDPYLRYPDLPELPDDSSPDLREWYASYKRWYSDLRLLLQRDREEMLARINKLS